MCGEFDDRESREENIGFTQSPERSTASGCESLSCACRASMAQGRGYFYFRCYSSGRPLLLLSSLLGMYVKDPGIHGSRDVCREEDPLLAGSDAPPIPLGQAG